MIGNLIVELGVAMGVFAPAHLAQLQDGDPVVPTPGTEEWCGPRAPGGVVGVDAVYGVKIETYCGRCCRFVLCIEHNLHFVPYVNMSSTRISACGRGRGSLWSICQPAIDAVDNGYVDHLRDPSTRPSLRPDVHELGRWLGDGPKQRVHHALLHSPRVYVFFCTAGVFPDPSCAFHHQRSSHASQVYPSGGDV